MLPKRMYVIALILVGLLTLTGCATAPAPLERQTTGNYRPVTGRDLRVVTGQTVYVPAYSEVFFGSEDTSADLAVTLAIHNTDFNSPIIIQSVRYYDTDGNVVLDYVEDPVEISPLATSGFLVEEGDRSGGWGSNFVVEWVAEEPVHEPLIEALMVSTVGLNGISMISLGRVISQTTEAVDISEIVSTPESE
jgi:hypothetical protein